MCYLCQTQGLHEWWYVHAYPAPKSFFETIPTPNWIIGRSGPRLYGTLLAGFAHRHCQAPSSLHAFLASCADRPVYLGCNVKWSFLQYIPKHPCHLLIHMHGVFAGQGWCFEFHGFFFACNVISHDNLNCDMKT